MNSSSNSERQHSLRQGGIAVLPDLFTDDYNIIRLLTGGPFSPLLIPQDNMVCLSYS